MLGLLALVWAAVATLRVGGTPSIEIDADKPGIGRRTSFRITLAEPRRGLTECRVELVQGDRVESLAVREWQPRSAWQFWGPATVRDELTVVIGSETISGLRSGEATLRVAVWPASTWLRRPEPRIAERVWPVLLTAPALQIRSSHHYVSQGGSGVVVYRVGDTALRDGVRVGETWFPGYPLPGGEAGLRFALFAVPFDLVGPTEIRLEAEDVVENRALLSFVDEFFSKSFRSDVIEITDEFMERVVPAIMAATPEMPDQGDLLANYLWINGELRRRNAVSLRELAATSSREFLWTRPFVPMSKGQVMSAFADRRTYRYQGREVDRQDHLGFDLASVRQAEIQAANRGTVVLADYLGIYGTTVVIDHGFGLMSLYGHLSSLAVRSQDKVEQGQTIGRSGQTGLAGGDHLHFTLLIQGHPVNPVEWWDGAWIRDRFAAKLSGAFSFEP